MSLNIKTNQDFMQILPFSGQQESKVRNHTKDANVENSFINKKLFMKSLKAAIVPVVLDEG